MGLSKLGLSSKIVKLTKELTQSGVLVLVTVLGFGRLTREYGILHFLTLVFHARRVRRLCFVCASIGSSFYSRYTREAGVMW
jgi:hypothetical protein